MSNPQTPKSGNIVWFEIPADNVSRAKGFYGALFGWQIERFPGNPDSDYWHLNTGGSDDSPDGGLMARKQPGQPIVNYFNVPSIVESMAKIEKLGGKVCMSKTAVPQMGYFAICLDTENNSFGIWEHDPNAK